MVDSVSEFRQGIRQENFNSSKEIMVSSQVVRKGDFCVLPKMFKERLLLSRYFRETMHV